MNFMYHEIIYKAINVIPTLQMSITGKRREPNIVGKLKTNKKQWKYLIHYHFSLLSICHHLRRGMIPVVIYAAIRISPFFVCFVAD